MLTVILVVFPPSLSFSGKAHESKIIPSTWSGSDEGTKNPNPSMGTTLPSYSKFTTPTVVLWILFSSDSSSPQSLGRMFASLWAGMPLITWSTVICSFGHDTVSLPSALKFTAVHGEFNLKFTPRCFSTSCSLSVSVCIPPWRDHVLQRSFWALVAKGLVTEVSGAGIKKQSYKKIEWPLACTCILIRLIKQTGFVK